MGYDLDRSPSSADRALSADEAVIARMPTSRTYLSPLGAHQSAQSSMVHLGSSPAPSSRHPSHHRPKTRSLGARSDLSSRSERQIVDLVQEHAVKGRRRSVVEKLDGCQSDSELVRRRCRRRHGMYACEVIEGTSRVELKTVLVHDRLKRYVMGLESGIILVRMADWLWVLLGVKV